MIVKRLIGSSIIGTLFVCLLVLACRAGEGEKSIKIAILPCTNIEITFKKFHPLVTYLQQETGFDIKILVPTDSAEFERAIKNGDIDFAFQDPHMYVIFANLYNRGILVRALNLDGKISQSGVVIVREDSLITKMEDLKGKTVMFGPTLSAAKWIAARLLFEESGINIDKDLKAYSNGGCCEDIAFNVYLKAVDAGVVCDHFLGSHFEKQQELGIEAKQIRVIFKTKSVPTRVFAARQEISNDIVIMLYQALLNLDKTNPEHAKILYEAELGGFQKSKDEDYDDIRVLIGAK